MELNIDEIAAEMRQLWPLGSFFKWPIRCVENLAIPDRSKRILAEVGLPYESLHGDDKTVWVAALDALTDERPECRVLNCYPNGDYAFFLDERRNGKLFWLFGDREIFVNSSVEHFAACMIPYKKYQIQREPFVDRDPIDMVGYLELFDRTEAEMRRIDAPAWGDMPLDWRTRTDSWKIIKRNESFYWPGNSGELNDYYP